MKVRKLSKANEPGYPSGKQFSACTRMAGVAVLGLGFVASGCDKSSDISGGRTAGVPYTPPAEEQLPRTGGVPPRVMPETNVPPVVTNAPSANTNEMTHPLGTPPVLPGDIRVSQE